MVFILGFLITAVGGLIIFKSEWMLNNFGRIGLFEEKLATSGGSRFGYKLIGLAAIFIGIMMMTGLIEGFLFWILGPLIKFYIPDQAAENLGI
jgi:hypothetical protein